MWQRATHKIQTGYLDANNAIVEVLQCLLHMPQFEFALRTAEITAKVRNLGQNWGMCGKHYNTTEDHGEWHLSDASAAR